jgi:hypothetical protein
MLTDMHPFSVKAPRISGVYERGASVHPTLWRKADMIIRGLLWMAMT